MLCIRGVAFIKLARHFRALRELWLLIGGFINSVKALAWVGFLIGVLLYPFSVMFTTEIGWKHEIFNGTASYDGKAWRYDIYFGSIWRTTFTLVQVLTRDGWCDGIVRHVLHKLPNMWIFFYIFMILSSFGLMNVIVGVIVENTLQAAKVADERVTVHQQWERGKLIDHMVDILTMSDVSRSGHLGLEEFAAAIEGPLMAAKLEAIDVSQQEAQEVYDMLDHERAGSVDIKAYADALKGLISQGSARDIVNVEVTVGALAATLDELEKSYVVMEKHVSDFRNYADDFRELTAARIANIDTLRKAAVTGKA